MYRTENPMCSETGFISMEAMTASGGTHFCLNDYVCYSADVTDLTDWRYEGVIYRKEQDPRNQNIPEDTPELSLDPGIVPQGPEDLNPRGIHAMWAPDVVQGPDGRYYLYYCLDFLPEIGAAVCDTPAGQYEFLGLVRHRDGTPLGTKEGDLIQFDPGIFVDDDGEIYLYSGNAPISQEWIEKDPDTPRKGSQVMKLESDMLTLKEEPKKLMPEGSLRRRLSPAGQIRGRYGVQEPIRPGSAAI